MASPSLRPTLNERRRAATELEIARAAAALFAEHGAEGTTAESIAQAAGIALRTFYRYFRSKEEAVLPLLSIGVRDWIADLRASAEGLPPGDLPDALEQSVRRALTPTDAASEEAMRCTRGLIRAMEGDPALLQVWQRVGRDGEDALVPVLAELVGPGADPLELRLASAAANAAQRIAVETWALAADPGPSPADLAARCVRELTAGLSLWGERPAG
jgi:AcrR family transcriptional regulator